MLRRLLLLSPLALAACHHQLSKQDVNIHGLVPPLSFTMTDVQTGKQVTAADFRGDVVLLYFGYTNCPDVCPTTLYNIQRVQKAMGKTADKVKVLFVTVDPDRDTPAVLTQYTALFGGNVVGLRGTPDELYSLARRYRVVFSVVKKPVYTVTHSAAIYVFNGKGQPEFIIAGLSTVKPDIDGIASDLRRVANG
ncbi:MAG: SCO family protein [Rhodospirillales bacterium]|nr:SCO family protein [Rhodospirillales bacterium]